MRCENRLAEETKYCVYPRGETREENRRKKVNYFIERSLFYYFLMLEVTEPSVNRAQLWKFVAKSFGVGPKDARRFGELLSAEVLDNFEKAEDVGMYKNFLKSFCADKEEFGHTEEEQTMLNIKALALFRTHEMFGALTDAANRQRLIAHNYESSSLIAMLYALYIACFNRGEGRLSYVKDILKKELSVNRNSDAGIVLLGMNKEEAAAVAGELFSLPDMLLRPDALKFIRKRYGIEGAVFPTDKQIGFTGGKNV